MDNIFVQLKSLKDASKELEKKVNKCIINYLYNNAKTIYPGAPGTIILIDWDLKDDETIILEVGLPLGTKSDNRTTDAKIEDLIKYIN